jgi:precorrin-6B methylase 2
MTQCQCEGIGVHFDDQYAAEKLALYRSSGPDPTTAALIAALLTEGIEGASLLDIGGGVGAIQHELIEAGAGNVWEVEASAAYQAACRQEAERRGHGDRIVHISGDLASVADEVPNADIVTLDRSVCCWPEMPPLLDAAASRAGRLLAMVYPRDDLWIRIGWRAYQDIRNRINRNPMRVFIHRTSDVEAILTSHGLSRRSRRTMGVWQVVVFGRDRA